jgi:hypothetical protein
LKDYGSEKNTVAELQVGLDEITAAVDGMSALATVGPYMITSRQLIRPGTSIDPSPQPHGVLMWQPPEDDGSENEFGDSGVDLLLFLDRKGNRIIPEWLSM